MQFVNNRHLKEREILRRERYFMTMQIGEHSYAWLLKQLLCALLFSVISISCTNPSPSPLCGSNDDCPSGQICTDGLCGDTTVSDLDPSIQCSQSSDCGDDARCVDGTCFQNECMDGMKRPCQTACGMGEELCSGGVWRACNSQPTTEICGTGEDEDCDSKIDENCQGCTNGEERPCATDCGTGVERCIDGQFIGCTAGRPRTEICLDPNAGVDEDCDGTIDEECESCPEEGSTRACETSCGEGVELCSGGVFRDCSAPIPSDEICNGADDDCDGEIDEQVVRDCNNQCGMGSERCVSGQWMGCDAPENCNCTPEDGVDIQLCGTCGERSRTCDTPQWGEWSECLMGGQCMPGASEEGDCGLCGTKRRLCLSTCEWGDWQVCLGEKSCSPSETEAEACPSGCGEKTRVCGDMCEWSEWSSCQGQNVACSPTDVETESCGACGQTRERVCNEICQWGGWGACVSVDNSCMPGDTQDQSCGACRTQTRSCSDECVWSDWGACQAGSCTFGQTEMRDCGFCGSQTRMCTSECAWSDWSPCTGGGQCTPGDEVIDECGIMTGECSFGSQVNTCDNSCNWMPGACEGGVGVNEVQTEVCGSEFDYNCDGELTVDADGFEPNNFCTSCRLVGGLDPSNFNLTATIDNFADDWDFYCFEVADTISINPFDLNEEITVSLTNVPSNKDYDLYLYKSEVDCRMNEELGSSTLSRGENESITWTEPLGEDDSGIYIVGVKGYSSTDYSCSEYYTLTIDGLH